MNFLSSLNYNHQIPNFKQYLNFNVQFSKLFESLEIGALRLFDYWCLEPGILSGARND